MSINVPKPPEPPKRGMIGPRISKASKTLRHRFNSAVSDEGLFSGQHHIILFLMHNPGATISQLASELGITSATACVSVKRMEKAGFIAKKSSDEDARSKALYLTEKGMLVTEHIKEKMDSHEESITKGLSEEEIMLLSDLLDRVIKNMEGDELSND